MKDPLLRTASPPEEWPRDATSPTSSSPCPLLTVGNLATLLGLTVRGVRLVLERGELPGFRIGRRWYVRPADLDTAISEKVAQQHRDRDASVRILRGLPAAPDSKELP